MDFNFSNVADSEAAEVLPENSSFRKYLQYRKRPQNMDVKKFVLVQTFHKIQGFADITNK